MSDADVLWMARSRKKLDVAQPARAMAPNSSRAGDTHRITAGVLLATLFVLGIAMAAVGVVLILGSDAIRQAWHRRTSSPQLSPVDD
jgi:hypothetical protein